MSDAFKYTELRYEYECMDGRCHHKCAGMVYQRTDENGIQSGPPSYTGKACPACRNRGAHNYMRPKREVGGAMVECNCEACSIEASAPAYQTAASQGAV